MQTAKIQRVIGKDLYINHRTGEVEEFNVINYTDSDISFEKIWLGHLLDALKIIGNKKVEILCYLLKHKDNKNIVIASQRKIAEITSISVRLVNETIQALVKVNAIITVQQGVYQLNPDIIFKGRHNSRMKILLDYSNAKVEQKASESEEEKIEKLNKEIKDIKIAITLKEQALEELLTKKVESKVA